MALQDLPKPLKFHEHLASLSQLNSTACPMALDHPVRLPRTKGLDRMASGDGVVQTPGTVTPYCRGCDKQRDVHWCMRPFQSLTGITKKHHRLRCETCRVEGGFVQCSEDDVRVLSDNFTQL